MGVKVRLLEQEKRDSFTCPQCALVLDCPYQAECGDRYCQACLKQMQANGTSQCLRCKADLNLKEAFKDSACQREVNKLMVRCGWGDCNWQGAFPDFKDHELQCPCRCDCGYEPRECRRRCRQCGFDEVERDGGGKEANNKMEQQLQKLQQEAQALKLALDAAMANHHEIVLMVQSLQATSYNGKYIWKIPDVDRRYLESKEGKTYSLYSAPFYTSRHGYRICLRLYLNGDGAGKGTHISFFITIMMGEFDALLPWPFTQVVKLSMRSQTKGIEDISHCFRADRGSSSFARPVSNMNIASGCPKFAPLGILSDENYVCDDVMFLQCEVDLEGIEHLF